MSLSKSYIKRLQELSGIESDIMLELFENPKMPINYEILKDNNGYKYIFSFEGLKYGVEFVRIKQMFEIMVPNEEVFKIIKENENKYITDFGPVNSKNEISDDVMTGVNKPIKIFSFVFAILKHFIENNKVDILEYFASKQRANVYNYIYENYLKNDFIYYTAKKHFAYSVYLIKKNLLKNIKDYE